MRSVKLNKSEIIWAYLESLLFYNGGKVLCVYNDIVFNATIFDHKARLLISTRNSKYDCNLFKSMKYVIWKNKIKQKQKTPQLICNMFHDNTEMMR